MKLRVVNREDEDDVKGGDTATSERRSSTLTGTAALQAATTRNGMKIRCKWNEASLLIIDTNGMKLPY